MVPRGTRMVSLFSGLSQRWVMSDRTTCRQAGMVAVLCKPVQKKWVEAPCGPCEEAQCMLAPSAAGATHPVARLLVAVVLAGELGLQRQLAAKHGPAAHPARQAGGLPRRAQRNHHV